MILSVSTLTLVSHMLLDCAPNNYYFSRRLCFSPFRSSFPNSSLSVAAVCSTPVLLFLFVFLIIRDARNTMLLRL